MGEFGAKCGAGFGAEFGANGGAMWDAALVVARLEEAGGVLLALPHAGPSPRLKISRLGAMAEALEGRGRDPLRLPAPSPEAVSRMDEALGWIGLIPQERYVLRRIVGARALVHPLSGRHLHSWRQVGALLGADHKAVQRWHREGVEIIVRVLNRTLACAS